MQSPSRILVCGGRDYADLETFNKVMNYAATWFAKSHCIIQGGATGADKMAKDWATFRGIPCIQVDANWYFYEKRAGMIRNGWMLEFCNPDLVIAFPGGSGTLGMVSRARLKLVPVFEVPR